MEEQGESLAIEIIERNNQLKAERNIWDTTWQDLANYIMPRKSQITERKTEGVDGYTQDLYSSVAIDSNFTLAAGQLNYMTPANEKWGRFEPPNDQRDNDEAKRWYSQCTDIALDFVKRSNFYQEVHECYLNRGAFGTANLMCEEGKSENPLIFKAHDTGSYSIEENEHGLVDVWFLEFPLTCRNAVKKYGIENCGKTLREAYEKDSGKHRSKKFNFIYAVFPREDSERLLDRMDGENMPIAAVTVCIEDKHVTRNSGFYEFPGGISRYLKWGNAAYGYCPSIQALPTIKQLNFIEKQMDALAELAAFPRFFIPSGYEGEVDLRPSGATIIKSQDLASGATPKEWMTGGRYDIGKDRANDKVKAIQDAFHVDLFNALAVREKTMTATEVLEIVAEKLVLFSPTFARVVTELLNPIMRRVFSILLRMGKFPEVPESVIVYRDGVNGEIPDPSIVYVSKIALATKAIENRSWGQFMQVLVGMLQLDPSVLDRFNFDRVLVDIADNLGLPADWSYSDSEVAQKQMEQAQKQQAADALAALESGSQSAKNLGQVPPDAAAKMGNMMPAQ